MFGAKGAAPLPMDQIRRCEKKNVIAGGQNHHPMPRAVFSIPNDLGVTKIWSTAAARDHGVARIFRPGAATVCAVGEALALFSLMVVRKNRHYGFFAETRRVMPIDNRASRKDSPLSVGRQRDGEVLP